MRRSLVTTSLLLSALVAVAVLHSQLLASSHASPGQSVFESDVPVRAVQRAAVVHDSVRNDVERTGSAEVIVLLRDGMAPSSDIGALTAAAESVQDAVTASVSPADFTVRTRYDTLPLLAGTVTAQGLAALEAHPLVVAVEDDVWMTPLSAERIDGPGSAARALVEAVPVVEADFVHDNYGITGEGVTVAVLDTGIDNEHPDFDEKILDQYCYSSSRSCAPNNIIEGPNAQDEMGHGTGVSGIILSSGNVSRAGVAPGAKLVAVRVFKDQGGAATSDIIKGLDWVLRRQLPLDIRVVNMSLGSGASRGNNCDDQQRSMKQPSRASWRARSLSSSPPATAACRHKSRLRPASPTPSPSVRPTTLRRRTGGAGVQSSAT